MDPFEEHVSGPRSISSVSLEEDDDFPADPQMDASPTCEEDSPPVVRPEQATECRYNPKRALKLALKFEKRMAVHGKIAQLCGYTVVAGFFAMLIVATLWFAEGIFQQVRAGEAEGFVWSWLLAIVWDLVVVEWVYALIKCAVKLAGATYLAVAFGFYNLVDWYEDYCDLTTIDMMAGDKLQKMLTTAMEDNEQMY
eukprot:CAMPEP_0117684638 /NCGR_PEP_ID=MMETSP0804-20121206/21226_1 /TAXON_ID=1074897 /ORGANISM="Tetraselmis astigmatica, Strain CCMP880" /LENGTH=195 /DNA_ID=CAMNT_0005495683 /DNA_START=176 /DNA_END=764 /DNA_ORIENTATION=-